MAQITLIEAIMGINISNLNCIKYDIVIVTKLIFMMKNYYPQGFSTTECLSGLAKTILLYKFCWLLFIDTVLLVIIYLFCSNQNTLAY